MAERTADFIWREGFKHGTGVCHYFDLPEGSPRVWGEPADQVNFLRALVDLYQATAEPRFLERAVELGETILEHYLGAQGWIIEAFEREAAGDGQEVLDDIPADLPDIIINGNGARILLALDALSPGDGFADAATRILGSLAGKYKAYTYFASEYALAAELVHEGLVEVRVAPDLSSDVRKEIVGAAVSAFNPRKLVRLETVEDYLPSDIETRPSPAVVCSPGKCQPVDSADELKDTLAALAGVETAGNGGWSAEAGG
jgi:uncharacterized protein YyaL (SSP411 family)